MAFIKIALLRIFLDEFLHRHFAFADCQKLIVILIDRLAGALNHILEQFDTHQTIIEGSGHSPNDFTCADIIIKATVRKLVVCNVGRNRTFHALIFRHFERQDAQKTNQLTLYVDTEYEIRPKIVASYGKM